ncbi:MAG: Nramp family divalent metal transporter [Candidatus Levybacteria bacterium]|nr:Nramp family divalent metal transporter [Candidatus Levybacteria bacterium]
MNLFRRHFRRILPVLAIIGPGIISGSVDNDAGGITTYSVAGARFGYSLLWVLFLTTFSLAITQEIGARMGLVTGKGLASLIREKFGLNWTAIVMVILFIANMGTIAAEFAGIAGALEIFNVPRFASVLIAITAVYFLVTRGNFKRLERIFLVISFFYISYIISAFIINPSWGIAVKSLVMPSFQLNNAYILTLMAVVGTTITPWGQFFIQDYVVDKKLSKEDLKIERGDVFLGSFLTNFIAFFIVVATAGTLFAQGINITEAKDAAIALKPLAGNFAAVLFSFGLLNASLFGAALVPVTTSYVITEAFGMESGLNFRVRQAPYFYGLFAFSLVLGGLMVIIPSFPLLTILIVSQALNAVLLLPIFIFLYLLSNDKKILGNYVNNRLINAVLIITFTGVAIASSIYLFSLFFPKGF